MNAWASRSWRAASLPLAREAARHTNTPLGDLDQWADVIAYDPDAVAYKADTNAFNARDTGADVVAYKVRRPTDRAATSALRGLAADAANEAAVTKIFAAKGRPSEHPLIVHVADAAAVVVQ